MQSVEVFINLWVDGADQQKAAQYISCMRVVLSFQILILIGNCTKVFQSKIFYTFKLNVGFKLCVNHLIRLLFTSHAASQYFWKLGCSLLAVLTKSATV